MMTASLAVPLDMGKRASMLGASMVQLIQRIATLVVLLLFSSWSQADGLFDFQMKLANKGNNPEAEYKIGEMYETGFGVDKDLNEARTWINKAAAQGHETAGFKLLYWDIEKNGLKDGSMDKFAELKEKAKAENPQAMYYVGKMYANGVGFNKNHDKALKWLNKATHVGVLAAEREASALVRAKQNNASAKTETTRQPVKQKKIISQNKPVNKNKPVKKTEAEIKKEKKMKQAARLKEYAILLKKEEELAKQAKKEAK